MGKKQKKAVALLSGGLDSTLAVKLILDQGIDVHALNFTSAFCTCSSRKDKRTCSESARVAKEFKIPFKVISKGLDYIRIIKAPKHGYGRAMNPCIDCRIYSFKKAKEFMEEIGGSFIITGEVLDQRPMSQRSRAMQLIEKESGLEGLVVRPLSARFLKPTIPEIEKIIDRNKLLGIQGRSRKTQIKLAEEMNIIDYPCAAGGCRLTESGYVKKLKDYLDHTEKYSLIEINLLICGRHFRLSDNNKVILGRDEKENDHLKKVNLENSVYIEPVYPGPSALIMGNDPDKYIDESLKLIKKYSSKEKFENSFEIFVKDKHFQKKIA